MVLLRRIAALKLIGEEAPDTPRWCRADVLAEERFVMADHGRHAVGEICDYARVSTQAWWRMMAEDAASWTTGRTIPHRTICQATKGPESVVG